jgi:predicted DNA-binding transcriptional regulator YafY
MRQDLSKSQETEGLRKPTTDGGGTEEILSSRRVESRSPILRMQRLHEFLLAGQYPNCRQMAEEMEVCSKTILRDLEFMRDQLQLPIEFNPRRYGYCYTRPFQLPVALRQVGPVVSRASHISDPLGDASRNQPTPVVLRIDMEVATKVLDGIPSNTQQVRATNRGSLEVTICEIVTPKLERWILGWASRVRVVSPSWLRTKMLHLAQEILALYGGESRRQSEVRKSQID